MYKKHWNNCCDSSIHQLRTIQKKTFQEKIYFKLNLIYNFCSFKHFTLHTWLHRNMCLHKVLYVWKKFITKRVLFFISYVFFCMQNPLPSIYCLPFGCNCFLGNLNFFLFRINLYIKIFTHLFPFCIGIICSGKFL